MNFQKKTKVMMNTCFRVMTSISLEINWVKIESLHVYQIRFNVCKLKMSHLVKLPHHILNFFILTSFISNLLILTFLIF